jgi:hypothetical protein
MTEIVPPAAPTTFQSIHGVAPPMLNPEPKRTTFRRDKVEPVWLQSKTEKLPPTLPQRRTEMDDPNRKKSTQLIFDMDPMCTTPVTEQADATRPKDRSDNDDPRCVKLNTE